MSGKPPRPPVKAEPMKRSVQYRIAADDAEEREDFDSAIAFIEKAGQERRKEEDEAREKEARDEMKEKSPEKLPGWAQTTRRRGGRLYSRKTMAKTRRNKSSGGDIVCHLLTIRNQIKLYHWQTKQFSRHTATDALTAALDTSIDAFVESYMGRYGRPKVSGSIKLHNFSESAAKTFVTKETKYLEQELPRKIGRGDSDLLNIRDEILAELTKVSYLFTLQ